MLHRWLDEGENLSVHVWGVLKLKPMFELVEGFLFLMGPVQLSGMLNFINGEIQFSLLLEVCIQRGRFRTKDTSI